MIKSYEEMGEMMCPIMSCRSMEIVHTLKGAVRQQPVFIKCQREHCPAFEFQSYRRSEYLTFSRKFPNDNSSEKNRMKRYLEEGYEVVRVKRECKQPDLPFDKETNPVWSVTIFFELPMELRRCFCNICEGVEVCDCR